MSKPKLPRPERGWIAVALVLAAAVTAIMANTYWRQLNLQSTLTGSGEVHVGAPFALVDHRGRAVTSNDFHGRPVLLIFGRTAERDRVLASLQVASAAIDGLGARRASIAPVFVTLDPETDTPDRLERFLAPLPVSWHGLTGTSDAIAALAGAYFVPGFSGGKPTMGAPPEGPPTAYLLDARGRFISHLVVPSDAEKLRAWIVRNL
ncbi:MAG: SCO family protein [Hyphomicrobiaceae bacterium]|nr:SCO family protein [Hyphomicrobiaceae bacterium]